MSGKCAGEGCKGSFHGLRRPATIQSTTRLRAGCDCFLRLSGCLRVYTEPPSERRGFVFVVVSATASVLAARPTPT